MVSSGFGTGKPGGECKECYGLYRAGGGNDRAEISVITGKMLDVLLQIMASGKGRIGEDVSRPLQRMVFRCKINRDFCRYLRVIRK